MTHCRSFTPSPDPEWGSVEKNFWQENACRKVLPAALPFNEPYRLITLAEIEAIDAKLAIKYPVSTTSALSLRHTRPCRLLDSVPTRPRRWSMFAFAAEAKCEV